MAKKTSLFKEFSKGLIIENPVLRLVLGTCPVLAVSTSMINSIGMGISATLVLLFSNIAVSALRKVIPQKIRIPAYVVIIASFVTIVQLIVKAFVPAIDEALGIFLPLIVVNCIILGRAEAFAGKNTVLASAADGLGMGIGFTAALFLMATFRELLGNGTVFSGAQGLLALFGENALGGFNGIDVFSFLPNSFEPMVIFILPAGGFFVFGILIAIANRLGNKTGQEREDFDGCANCPLAQNCSSVQEQEREEVKA